MYIRDRIFQKLDELDMTQKEFSEKTGIPQSTISDWRKKKTNPTAEKVMIICKVLDVTPQWLLSGIEAQGDRGNPHKWFAIDAETRVGRLVTEFNRMDSDMQERLLGYAEALGQSRNGNKGFHLVKAMMVRKPLLYKYSSYSLIVSGETEMHRGKWH